MAYIFWGSMEWFWLAISLLKSIWLIKSTIFFYLYESEEEIIITQNGVASPTKKVRAPRTLSIIG